VPRFEITQPTSVSPEEARRRLDQLNAGLRDRHGLDPVWVSPTEVRIKRSGASGTLRIEPGSIRVQVELSFLLGAVRGEIESRIKHELAELFPS